MLADVVHLLCCPSCGADVHVDAKTLRCNQNHVFDIARQGYVNFLGGAHGSADTPTMVAARDAFLAAGHYDRVAQAVSQACQGSGGAVVEVGAGTGHYLADVLRTRPGAVGVALDISVAAARRAARAHPRIGAVVADAWAALPLRDGCADLALVVFAPRGAAEIARVVRPGGRLVVVTPEPGHLAELVGPLGLLGVGTGKPERLQAALGPWFEHCGQVTVAYRLELAAADVTLLAGMGPSAFHTAADELHRRVGLLPNPATVSVAVTVTSFARR